MRAGRALHRHPRVAGSPRKWCSIFPVGDIQGARVERSRATRGEQQNIYRPVLLTTRGEFPLSHDWMGEEQEAERVVDSINHFLTTPGAPGFSMWHDDRPQASRMGAIFTVAAGWCCSSGCGSPGAPCAAAARSAPRQRLRGCRGAAGVTHLARAVCSLANSAGTPACPATRA